MLSLCHENISAGFLYPHSKNCIWGLTISNEHQTGCALSLAIHQVKGERSLISDLQRIHEHLNDAGRLVKVHCVFLEAGNSDSSDVICGHARQQEDI